MLFSPGDGCELLSDDEFITTERYDLGIDFTDGGQSVQYYRDADILLNVRCLIRSLNLLG